MRFNLDGIKKWFKLKLVKLRTKKVVKKVANSFTCATHDRERDPICRVCNTVIMNSLAVELLSVGAWSSVKYLRWYKDNIESIHEFESLNPSNT